MGRQDQLKLAYSEADEARKKAAARLTFLLAFDDQLDAALRRIECTLHGQDVHKWIAEEMTDDAEHPVSVTQVHDWLSRRNGRRPPADMIAIVYEADVQFAAWWNEKLHYTIPEKLIQLSWEEERRLYRKALLEFGPSGEQKLRAISAAKPEREVLS